ncbi:MAG: SAM-dependent chlorinase/fluorinase [Deltaproteobacteria bacterium]|nr:MAG: SAM-dependent chlorinase/fluorinase [Deltaproteobacteria bacterium]
MSLPKVGGQHSEVPVAYGGITPFNACRGLGLITSGIITLTTDFGEGDPYVAMMKGVILCINPAARIVDITHQVPAGSIQEGGSIIRDAYKYFSDGTVHVGVIDPGVGGKRRPVVVLANNHFFVGPDNGLFWPVIEKQVNADIIHLKEKRYWMNKISPTFHGRDIFAPVAAHLSLGLNPFVLGEKIDDPTTIAYPLPCKKDSDLVGEVIRVDHFGNLITNITREHLTPLLKSKDVIIKIGSLVLDKISTTYSDVPDDEPLALIGSSNLLEIAINMGRATNYLGKDCRIGTKVTVECH